MLVVSHPASIYGPCAVIRRSAGVTQQARGPRVHERWAHLRFSVIGHLLAAPPPKGELRAEIEAPFLRFRPRRRRNHRQPGEAAGELDQDRADAPGAAGDQ